MNSQLSTPQLSTARNGHAPAPPRHWLRRITAEDVAPLHALALADAHAVIEPTHVFEKHGELAGYASLASVPLLLTWFHTQRCRAADSLFYIQQLELLMANALPPGHNGVMCAPCGQPFAPFIQKLGYVDGGPMNICFKKLR